MTRTQLSQADRPTALTEQQIGSFLRNGFLRLTPGMSVQQHDRIFWSTDRIFLRSGIRFNPLNNILPMVPELRDMLNDPYVVEAASTLLGPNYLVHPHRHCHTNFANPGAETPAMLQGFHKDGHAVKPRPRHREPRWLILFYSPQDTPLHRGPTAVMPGSHLMPALSHDLKLHRPPPVTSTRDSHSIPDSYVCPNINPLAGPPAVVLCHFDIGHGAMMNGSVLNRYVHKFVLMRTEKPSSASLGSIEIDDPVQSHLWSWLGYEVNNTAPVADLAAWKQNLSSTDIRERVKATYESPRVAQNNRREVLSHLRGLVRAKRFEFENNPVLDIADEVNGIALVDDDPSLLELIEDNDPFVSRSGCYGAGQARSVASIPSLLALLQSDDFAVLRHSISALGMIVGETNEKRTDCIAAFGDLFSESDDWDVRLFIVQALVRLGCKPDLVPLLGRAANDRNAYVSSFAIEQLCRINTDDARRAAMQPLREQRWFPHDRATV